MADELDIYRRQGFANSVGIGKAPALVIVDFVIGITSAGQAPASRLRPASGQIAAIKHAVSRPVASVPTH